MDFDAEKYKDLTDSIADLIKRENDLLQKASQADGGTKKRWEFVDELHETTRALNVIEAQRRARIKAIADTYVPDDGPPTKLPPPKKDE